VGVGGAVEGARGSGGGCVGRGGGGEGQQGGGIKEREGAERWRRCRVDHGTFAMEASEAAKDTGIQGIRF